MVATSSILSSLNLAKHNYDKPESLHDFLNTVIKKRFELYISHPEAARMTAWQILENIDTEHDVLRGKHNLSPRFWLPAVNYLQQQNKIRTDIKAAAIVDFIAHASSTLDSPSREIITEEDLKHYCDFIIDGLSRALIT